MRWCARPWDPRTGKHEPTTGKPDKDLSEAWDDARYNWLGDSYSSHVNPAFWKIHGWVDDKIEDWYRANKNTLSSINVNGIVWYEGDLVTVSDPWSGGMRIGVEPNKEMIKKMEKAARVVLDLPRLYHFYDT